MSTHLRQALSQAGGAVGLPGIRQMMNNRGNGGQHIHHDTGRCSQHIYKARAKKITRKNEKNRKKYANHHRSIFTHKQQGIQTQLPGGLCEEGGG